MLRDFRIILNIGEARQGARVRNLRDKEERHGPFENFQRDLTWQSP